jgi:hypothetical protein
MSNLFSVVFLYIKNRSVDSIKDIQLADNNIGQVIYERMEDLSAVIVVTDNNSYYYHRGSLESRDSLISLYAKYNCVLTDPVVVRVDSAILQDVLSQLYAEIDEII